MSTGDMKRWVGPNDFNGWISQVDRKDTSNKNIRGYSAGSMQSIEGYPTCAMTSWGKSLEIDSLENRSKTVKNLRRVAFAIPETGDTRCAVHPYIPLPKQNEPL